MALSPERQSARMSKIKNGGLDQYGTEPFEQQQFGTAGVEGVKTLATKMVLFHIGDIQTQQQRNTAQLQTLVE